MTQTPPIWSAEQEEAAACALCKYDGGDPYSLEPGDVPCIDEFTANGDPAHYLWRQYAEEATLALTAAASIPARGVETLTLDGFGQALVAAMDERGATVRGLAEQLGIDKSAISRARTGKGIEARHFIDMWNWLATSIPASRGSETEDTDGRVQIIEQSDTLDGGYALTLELDGKDTAVVVHFAASPAQPVQEQEPVVSGLKELQEWVMSQRVDLLPLDPDFMPKHDTLKAVGKKIRELLQSYERTAPEPKS